MKLKRRSDTRTFKGRTLDVSLREDPRNGSFLMGAVLSPVQPAVSKLWKIPASNRLDQGREGACVGYAGAHLFGTEPIIQKVTNKIARAFYKGAQKNDEWAGENYEGSSINGLMRFLKQRGDIGEYRWISSLVELQKTIANHGPVVVGSAWKEGCFSPNRAGFIRFTGSSKGGHATEWVGVNMEDEYFTIQQSWGLSHGIQGQVKMSFAETEKLLRTYPQIAFASKNPLKAVASKKLWWKFWK